LHDYYGELQKGLMHCSIVEGTEDSICRFYSGLRRQIQDIVDYKEFNTINQLFQCAMLAEKELQGREQQNKTSIRTSFAPHTLVHSGLAKPCSFRTPTSAGKRPATSGVSAAPNKPFTHVVDSGKNSLQVPAQSSLSVASIRRTSGIQCHRCHGIGHVKKDCPSQRAYVVTEDGGYISTSDVEEEDYDDDVAANDAEDHVLCGGDTSSYMNIIVQRVLSTQIQQPERLQRHNLFQIFFIIKNHRARVIIDGGSCNNLVSLDLVTKLCLITRPHLHPYHI
jgi:hypothetical protein